MSDVGIISPCLSCHSTSWEQKREQALGTGGYKTLQSDSRKNPGLLCSHCQSCLSRMLEKTRLNPSSDQWANEVSCFLADPLSNLSFTGSCCECRVKISKKCTIKIANASRNNSQSSSAHPVTSTTPSKSIYVEHQVAPYDGYLHYPEYNLLAHEERSKACPSMEYQLYCLTL
jgi:hypothetical protein